MADSRERRKDLGELGFITRTRAEIRRDGLVEVVETMAHRVAEFGEVGEALVQRRRARAQEGGALRVEDAAHVCGRLGIQLRYGEGGIGQRHE